MAQVWRLMMFATGLLCVGIKQVAANAEVVEMKNRLSSIEANQQKARDSLLQLGQMQAQDIDDKTQYCQDLKSTVAEQGQLLLDIKQHLQDELCKNESHPVVDNSGPCNPDNYTVIDDERRAINGEYHGYEDLCDKSIQPGWYRFLLHHRNAVVPTACVPKNNCQTDAPTWVDLQGQSLPGVGQHVEARACSHWYDDCCHWEAPITVRNCGDYFVYKIQPLVTCDLSFCVESAN